MPHFYLRYFLICQENENFKSYCNSIVSVYFVGISFLSNISSLKEKINDLEYYLDRYAIPAASCHKIKIIPKIRKIIASNFMGKAEYELDYEEYEVVNKALQEQLQRYKDEYKNLKCE